jgi:hypothetical protein
MRRELEDISDAMAEMIRMNKILLMTVMTILLVEKKTEVVNPGNCFQFKCLGIESSGLRFGY